MPDPFRHYEGVPLIDLLNDAVIITDNAAHRNDILRKYVVVGAPTVTK